MNVPGMPGTSIQAPPGNTVTNVTDNGTDVRAIFHVGPDPGLVNTTWTMYNSTSGSTATATSTIVTPDRIEFKDSHGERWRYIISVCSK